MSERQVPSHDVWVERILTAMKGIEYGTIQITIHDSHITQIERLERMRYPVEKRDVPKRGRE